MKRLHTDDRKKQLLEHSIKLIHKSGYGGFTVRELAASSGITEGAVYRHFKSKDDIIENILLFLSIIGEGLHKGIESIEHPQTKLHKFILFHLELFESMPELSSIFFNEEIFGNNDNLKLKLFTVIKSRQNILETIIEECQKSGGMVKADYRDITMMFQGYLRITVLKWRRSGFKFSLVERGKSFLNTIDTVFFQ